MDEFRKYAIVFYLTSRDAKRYVVRYGHYDTSEMYFDQEHFETNFWPMFYFCHTHWAWCTGISMRSFIRIRPVLTGDMPRTHTYIHTHTEGHSNSLANAFGAWLIAQKQMQSGYINNCTGITNWQYKCWQYILWIISLNCGILPYKWYCQQSETKFPDISPTYWPKSDYPTLYFPFLIYYFPVYQMWWEP